MVNPLPQIAIIEEEVMNNKRTIQPGKEIIGSKANSFRKKFLKIIEQGVKELVMDFSGVKTIDSMGLGVIFATNYTFENAGGKLWLINVPKEYHALCKAMRLDGYFKV